MARDGSEDAASLSQGPMNKVETATQIYRNGGRPEIDYAERARQRRLGRQLAAKEHVHLDRHGTRTADATGSAPALVETLAQRRGRLKRGRKER